MTAQFDVNTIASWAAVAAAAVGAARFGRKASRWFERTDERLDALEKEQTATKEQVKKIDAQLRPNGGGSHHDVLRREIREAVEEAAGTKRRRSWW